MNGAAERSDAYGSASERADTIHAGLRDEIVRGPIGNDHETLHRHTLRGRADDGAMSRGEFNLSRHHRRNTDVGSHEYQLRARAFLLIEAELARCQYRHRGEARRWIGDSDVVDGIQAPWPANYRR